MKLLSGIVALVSTIFAGTAQDIRYGVVGGAVFANQSIETEGLDLLNIDYDTNSRFSWEAGMLVDIPIDDAFSVQPSLLLSNKGYRYKDEVDGFEIVVKSKPLYLHIPIPVLIHQEFEGLNLFGGLGPYLSIGIGGEIDTEGMLGNFAFASDGDIDWGNDTQDDYRSTDFGLVFTGGIEIDDFQLGLVYDWGLKNIASNANEDNRTKNRSFGIRAVYFLSL